jgi:hypothetical protein
MAAILKIGNFIQVPVRLEINDAGKNAVFSFRLTGKRLSVEQWKSHFTDGGEYGDQPVKDFLLDHITAWDGQTLVMDDQTNQPAAFNRENFELMLGVLGVQQVVFQGYLKEVLKARAPEGRAKN